MQVKMVKKCYTVFCKPRFAQKYSLKIRPRSDAPLVFSTLLSAYPLWMRKRVVYLKLIAVINLNWSSTIISPISEFLDVFNCPRYPSISSMECTQTVKTVCVKTLRQTKKVRIIHRGLITRWHTFHDMVYSNLFPIIDWFRLPEINDVIFFKYWHCAIKHARHSFVSPFCFDTMKLWLNAFRWCY